MAARRPSFASVLAAVLIAVGAGTLAYPALAYGATSLRQTRLAAEARTLRGAIQPQAPVTSVANVVAFRPEEGQPLGMIRIPGIGLEAVFFEGVDEEVFLSGPGHLPWTALPGSAGTSVLAAHRDMHFRDLKELQHGDRVVLDLPDRSIRYRVVGRAIADPNDGWVVKQRANPVLRLVTCWPPTFIGPAPERLIVSAVPVGRRVAEPVGPAKSTVARTITLQTRDANPLSPSSLPLAGSVGAGVAALAGFAALRLRKPAWGFLGWFGGTGLIVLTLLAAWAGPGLAAKMHVSLTAERRPPPRPPVAAMTVLRPLAVTDSGSGLVKCRHAVLARPAMRALLMAQQRLGFQIPVVSSFRTHQQQAMLHRQKPGLAAPPGHSLHERGLAIDVPVDFLRAHPETAAVLQSVGFARFSPTVEPWHFSFGVRG